MDTSRTQPFVDIFASQPHIFADTALRLTRKACWAAWAGGPGYDLHAEYTLAISMNEGEHFQWDRVTLTKDDEKSELGRDVYMLENDQFGYMVVRQHYPEDNAFDYRLLKYDIICGIFITIFLSHNVREYDTKHIFDSCATDITCLQIYREGQESINFCSVFGDMYMSRHDIDRLSTEMPPPSIPWRQVIDHNIKSIIDFMKTSRLDIGDYLPTYTFM